MSATATASRPRRPASARGGRGNSARVAYDLGRRGEAAPAWVGDNPSFADAYERGVSDRDAAEAGSTRRSSTADDDVSTSAADSTRTEDSPAAGGDDGGARDDTVSVDQPPASLRRQLASSAGTDARNAGGWLSGRVDVDDAAGILWGLIGYGVLVSAITNPSGPVEGVKAWFRAKFFNITPATKAANGGQVDAPLAQLLAPPTSAGMVAPHVSVGPAPANSQQLLGQLLTPGAVPAPKPPAPATAGVR